MPVRQQLTRPQRRSLKARARKKSSGVSIILSTFGSEQDALDAANIIVGRGICSCVNLVNVRSVYRWRGKINDEKETAALFKTSTGSAKRLKKALIEIHPYEVPEILEIITDASSQSYLEWVVGSSNGVAQEGDDAPK